ncbi:MAG: hypothetical protein Q9159_006376 [Coniocarpon cinnabarinum]
MSSYEADHNLPSFDTQQRQSQHRRPDLSTFFSTLELIDTAGSSDRSHNNQNALPIPSNVSAAYRQLANSYQVMLGETEGVYVPEGQERAPMNNEWVEGMIEQLMQNANNPPERPKGLPNSFFDELDRVPKKSLKAGDSCPICGNPFLDDKCFNWPYINPAQDAEVDVRSPEFHGNKEADAQVAPLPHGWYGHDATTPRERDLKLLARNEAVKAAAGLDKRHSTVSKREVKDIKRKEPDTPIYEYDEHGYIVGIKIPRDYPEGFEDPPNGKMARRFLDEGAEPASSWFPKLFRRAVTKRDPVPMACASHNIGCRSFEEKQAMADVLSGAAERKL